MGAVAGTGTGTGTKTGGWAGIAGLLSVGKLGSRVDVCALESACCAVRPNLAAPGALSGKGSVVRTAPPQRGAAPGPATALAGAGGGATSLAPSVTGPRNVMLMAPKTP
jgi:hypothetical protein